MVEMPVRDQDCADTESQCGEFREDAIGLVTGIHNEGAVPAVTEQQV